MSDIKPAYELAPKGVPKGLAKILPFTGSLTSLPFIAKIALLARIGVALARIAMDYPAFNHNPQYTDTQKRTSFYERIFIEGGGTIVYHAGMYLAMDAVARLWERTNLKKHFLKGLHQLTEDLPIKGLNAGEKKELSALLEKFYRHFYETRPNSPNHVDGLVHLNLFGGDLYNAKGPRSHHGFLDKLRTVLEKKPAFAKHADDIISHATKATAPLSRSLVIKGGTLVQLAGVAVGCVLGGTVIQQINDHIIRPMAQKLSGDISDKIIQPPKIVLPGTRFSPDASPVPFHVNTVATQQPMQQQQQSYPQINANFPKTIAAQPYGRPALW